MGSPFVLVCMSVCSEYGRFLSVVSRSLDLVGDGDVSCDRLEILLCISKLNLAREYFLRVLVVGIVVHLIPCFGFYLS